MSERIKIMRQRLQAIIDWADLALANPQVFDRHGVNNLAGPVFDEARAALQLQRDGTATAVDPDAPAVRSGWDAKTTRPNLRPDGIPTRVDIRWMSSAELAIVGAMRSVEEAGGSLQLTAAVTLLQQARDLVADHVEGVPLGAALQQQQPQVPAGGEWPEEKIARVAASIASMVCAWVEHGIKTDQPWQNGLEGIIRRRLGRLGAER